MYSKDRKTDFNDGNTTNIKDISRSLVIHL